MPDLPVMRPRQLLKHLKAFGCELVSIEGSHHKIHYAETNLTTVLAIHSGKDITKRTFASTLKQLGIDVDEFLDFIK